MSEPRKTIVINPDFLKFPMRGNRSRKANRENAITHKPIKIRSENAGSDKTIKRRALNYIRKQQEDRYKRLVKGLEPEGGGHRVETTDGKTYADGFKSDFDDSLAFLQKLTDQTAQKTQVHNATLRQYPNPHTDSSLFQSPVLNQILSNNLSFDDNVQLQNTANNVLSLPPIRYPNPTYGCLKGGTLPTYRTMKSHQQNSLKSTLDNTIQPGHELTSENLIQRSLGQSIQNNHLRIPEKEENSRFSVESQHSQMNAGSNLSSITDRPSSRLTPEQQRAELKQFLEKRKEEKSRIERVKQQRSIMKPSKKQKRTTTRTFRVGKSKHYPKVGVLIPNKTIRTQILAKKQKIRETPIQDIRKYLIKNGLIRVGSSCPNDVLRQMYESSMMMCGEIQNHNPDNLLYNYLHNAI